MQIIYQSQFIMVGDLARDGFEEGLLITFSEYEATDDMVEYCFIHTHGELLQDFELGDSFVFEDRHFSVTAIGKNALANFRALGHATFYFDGAEAPKLPGAIHLLGRLPASILNTGCQFMIKSY